ncbi:MAG: hypothetical protein GXO81_09395 [Chlorobi bacterium]|nr:hypothetical protein [Chlorobiota bacterium]
MKSKVLFPLLLIIFFTLSCKKGNDTYIKPLNVLNACGKEDPLNQLGWLNELANKSLNDKSGNYIGNIWIVSYEGSDIIVTDMALGSGGILYYFFDCNGDQCSTMEGLDINDLNSSLTDLNKVFSTVK